MTRQRQVLVTVTYNDLGCILDTKAEPYEEPNLQPTCNNLATDTISRQAAIDNLKRHLNDTDVPDHYPGIFNAIEEWLSDWEVPPAQPEIIRCKDCRFWQNQEEGVVEVPICARPENRHEKHPFRFIVGADGYCSFAERITDE